DVTSFFISVLLGIALRRTLLAAITPFHAYRGLVKRMPDGRVWLNQVDHFLAVALREKRAAAGAHVVLEVFRVGRRGDGRGPRGVADDEFQENLRPAGAA